MHHFGYVLVANGETKFMQKHNLHQFYLIFDSNFAKFIAQQPTILIASNQSREYIIVLCETATV